MYCSSCGTKSREGDRYCLKCGAEVDAGARSQPRPAEGDELRERASTRGHKTVLGDRKVLLTMVLFFAGVVIGYGVYSLVAARAYAGAKEGYRRGDCRNAIPRFEKVYGVYKLAVTSATEEARARAAECRRLMAADRAVRGPDISEYPDEYASALVTYQRLVQQLPHDAGVLRARAAHGLDAIWSFKEGRGACEREPYLASISSASDLGTRLRNQAKRELPETTLACARGQRRKREFQAAIETYQTLIRDYPGSRLRNQAKRELPETTLAWARGQRRKREFQAAIKTYQTLIRDYPGSRAAISGRSELIATRVDRYAARAGKGELPPPPVSGQGASGSPEITIANGSPESLELLFSGPAMADSIRISACGGCQEVSSGEDASSCSSAPSRTIHVDPGPYRVVARSPSDGSIKPFVGKWDLQSSYTYHDCYFIKRRR
jgi:tetratricopeptide (TPR) repeat protein